MVVVHEAGKEEEDSGSHFLEMITALPVSGQVM